MPVPEEIAERIRVFKDCITAHGVERAYSDHICRHDCAIVNFEQSLRAEVAEHFGVPIGDIYIVGSAKLGFSPKPGQYFKPFSDASDIDIAIISRDLFARIWHEVTDMHSANEYFDFEKFRHYHFKGWIRPDKMPASTEYETCRDWWEFFQQLSGKEEYMRTKISAGLYHDDRFLRRYQLGGLLSLREHMERSAA